jgi:catechol 2,3-dioxygenase-like lactoylglutathione lyase family enzyme
MSAIRVNHVSVNAADLDASVAFYTELFDAQPIPTPNFGIAVRWLGIGDTQLHLFERDVEPPTHHHFAFEVEDFASVYRRAGERGAYDSEAFGHHFFELPGDTAQLYLRDPAGNLVEVDAPQASELPADILAERKRLADVNPQTEENERARLYLGGARATAQSRAESPTA